MNIKNFTLGFFVLLTFCNTVDAKYILRNNNMKAIQKLTKITFGGNVHKTRAQSRLVKDSSYYDNGSGLILSNSNEYKYLSTFGYDPTFEEITVSDANYIINIVDEINNQINSVKHQPDTTIQTNNGSTFLYRNSNTFNTNHFIIENKYENFNGTVWSMNGRNVRTLNSNNYTTEEIYYNNNNVQNNKSVYTYTNNKLTTVTSYDWNTVTSIWDLSTKSELIYNTNNTLSEYTYFEYNNGAWENSEHYIFTYNTNTKLTNFKYEYWDGTTWQKESEEIYTYNINNQVTQLNYWEYIQTPPVWKATSKGDYTYGTTSATYPSNILFKTLDTLTNTYTDNNKLDNTYNNSNQITSQITSFYNSSNWEISNKKIFVYSTFDATSINNSIYTGNNINIINSLVKNEIYITNKGVNTKAYIYNVTGNCVFQANINNGNNTLLLNNLANGIYVLKVGNTSYKFNLVH